MHAATVPNWYIEINVTFYSVTLARTIWLPYDGPRTETCRSVFSVLICKFYKFYVCAVVGIIIEELNNMHGVTTKIGVGVQHAVRINHIVICVPSDSRNFFSRHFVNVTLVRRKLLNIKRVY